MKLLSALFGQSVHESEKFAVEYEKLRMEAWTHCARLRYKVGDEFSITLHDGWNIHLSMDGVTEEIGGYALGADDFWDRVEQFIDDHRDWFNGKDPRIQEEEIC